MKGIFLIFLIGIFNGCNSESERDTTRGNSDTTTDSIAIKQDNTINRDTAIPIDTTVGYR